jgi:hypothetical protein
MSLAYIFSSSCVPKYHNVKTQYVYFWGEGQLVEIVTQQLTQLLGAS